MSDFRARLFLERDQLLDRIEKLKGFIVGSGYDNLPEIEQKALVEQLGYMDGYFSVLDKRVSRLCN